jgi:uncharacterized protein
MKCFYHNDPDGWCSAYWVRKYCEERNIEFTSDDFIEMNNDKEFPMSILSLGELVFMVDFSLNRVEDMIAIAANCDFVWIDHHKTAIEKMQKVIEYYAHEEPRRDGTRFRYLTIDGVAACMLTWLWCNYPNVAKDLSKDKDEIEAFITGFPSYIDGPCDTVFDYFITDDAPYKTTLERMIIIGYRMIMFRNSYAAGLCQSIGKVIEFEGHQCFACNMAHVSSEWFKSVDPETYDILMPFYYNMQTDKFIISLYSTKTDVSKIAVKYGGGGHSGAAGFQSRNLPWVK